MFIEYMISLYYMILKTRTIAFKQKFQLKLNLIKKTFF